MKRLKKERMFSRKRSHSSWEATPARRMCGKYAHVPGKSMEIVLLKYWKSVGGGKVRWSRTLDALLLITKTVTFSNGS